MKVTKTNATFKNMSLNLLLTSYASRVKVKAGDFIYRNGQSLNSLYVIYVGYFKVEYSLPDGQYQINHFALPGELLGSDGLADGTLHLDVTALTDGLLYELEFNRLHELKNSQPELQDIYGRLLSHVINGLQDHLFSLGTHNAEQRLAYFLVHFYKAHQNFNLDLNAIRLPMCREDLKSYLGITSETLSRCFSMLEKNGCLRINNRNISHLDLQRLEDIISPKEYPLSRKGNPVKLESGYKLADGFTSPDFIFNHLIPLNPVTPR